MTTRETRRLNRLDAIALNMQNAIGECTFSAVALCDDDPNLRAAIGLAQLALQQVVHQADAIRASLTSERKTER